MGSAAACEAVFGWWGLESSSLTGGNAVGPTYSNNKHINVSKHDEGELNQ